jgi:hypothetical protein
MKRADNGKIIINCPVHSTGEGMIHNMRQGYEQTYCIDAPIELPAGSTYGDNKTGCFYAMAQAVLRKGAYSAEF